MMRLPPVLPHADFQFLPSPFADARLNFMSRTRQFTSFLERKGLPPAVAV